MFDFVLCHNRRTCNSQMCCGRLASVADILLWMCAAFHTVHAVATLKYVAHDSWLLPKVHGELRVELTF